MVEYTHDVKDLPSEDGRPPRRPYRLGHAGTGIYWNKKWGVFRIHTTTTDVRKMVLVDTDKHRVLISPADIHKFVKAASGKKYRDLGL